MVDLKLTEKESKTKNAIIQNIDIVRKTYRWIALLCLVIFWSVITRKEQIGILGIQIELSNISLALYLLVTLTSLYILVRFKVIAQLIEDLSGQSKIEVLHLISIHPWLLNPFIYTFKLNHFKTKTNLQLINKIEQYNTRINGHLNAIKILFMPLLLVFMTLILATQGLKTREMNFYKWIIDASFATSVIGVFKLLKFHSRLIDSSFINAVSWASKKQILINIKVRNNYLNVVESVFFIVFIVLVYFGPGLYQLIKNIP